MPPGRALHAAWLAEQIGKCLTQLQDTKRQAGLFSTATDHRCRLSPLERRNMTTESAVSKTRQPLVINGLNELRDRAGTDLGVSDWVTVDQERVTTFGKLTGDEQWIHVDPERAKAGLYGTTVQHGFLTLGMATGLLWSVCVVEGFTIILNYGLNRVRFPSPLRVGDRFRMHVSLAEVNELSNGAEAVYHLEYEVEGQQKPCCVADLVFRYYS